MKLKHLFFYALSGMLAVACTEADEQFTVNNQGTLTIISSGSNQFATRAVADSKWESGDAIGVYMLKADGSAIDKSTSENVMFKTTLDAASTSATFNAETGIPLLNDQSVNVYAYYPYSDTKVTTDYIYNVQIENQSSEADLASHDLRWGKTSAAVSSTSLTSGLSLTFAHKLTLLKVKVNSDVESVSVSGVNTSAKFDIKTGALSEQSAEGTIQLYQVDAKNYMAVVVPTGNLANNLVLTIANADKTYKYVYQGSEITEFVGGYQYLFDISLAGTTNVFDKIEADLGDGYQEGGTISGTTEEPESIAPEGYNGILVTSDMDLNSQLNGLSAGKHAFIFTANSAASYTVGDVTIPSGVTGLIFMGKNATPVQLNVGTITLAADASSAALTELKYNNVEVIGESTKQLIAQGTEMANNSVVEIEDCYFHGMKNIFSAGSNSTNTMASLSIKNSCIGNAGDLFTKYKVTNVTLNNSTIYNMGRVINASNANITVDVQNCTLINTSGTPLETSEANSANSLIYKNNISACYRKETKVDSKNANIAYRMTVQNEGDFVGNYAIAGYTESNNYYFPLIKVAGKELTNNTAYLDGSATIIIDDTNVDNPTVTFAGKVMNDVFEDAASGNFTLKSGIPHVGDPRWYTVQ